MPVAAPTADALGGDPLGVGQASNNDWRDDPRAYIAAHEAGHAVASFLLLDTPVDASIIPDDTTLGRIHTWPPSKPGKGYFETVIMKWAGGYAERRFKGDYWNPIGDGPDRQSAEALCLKYSSDPAGDMSRASLAARRLVQEHWGAIETVAKALCEHEFLTEAQLRRIIPLALIAEVNAKYAKTDLTREVETAIAHD